MQTLFYQLKIQDSNLQKIFSDVFGSKIMGQDTQSLQIS